MRPLHGRFSASHAPYEAAPRRPNYRKRWLQPLHSIPRVTGSRFVLGRKSPESRGICAGIASAFRAAISIGAAQSIGERHVKGGNDAAIDGYRKDFTRTASAAIPDVSPARRPRPFPGAAYGSLSVLHNGVRLVRGVVVRASGIRSVEAVSKLRALSLRASSLRRAALLEGSTGGVPAARIPPPLSVLFVRQVSS